MGIQQYGACDIVHDKEGNGESNTEDQNHGQDNAKNGTPVMRFHGTEDRPSKANSIH